MTCCPLEQLFYELMPETADSASGVQGKIKLQSIMYMKPTKFLLIILLLSGISLLAQPVSMEKARLVATTAISLYSGNDQVGHRVQKMTLYHDSDNLPLFYFSDLYPRGYLMISARYDLPPLIAYSFNDQADEDGRLINFVRSDLSLRVKNSQELPENMIQNRRKIWEKLDGSVRHNPGFKQWPERGKSPEEGWLTTNWTQNAPYNWFCPLDPISGTRSVAGCPAVAMGQIINFHVTTSNVYFSDEDDYYHNYSGRQYWIDDDHLELDFPSFPQLNEYLSTLKTHYQQSQTLTSEDKAALVFACGVAARQVFASNGSGTFGVSQAYDAYVKFNVATAELMDGNDTSIYTRMACNIMDTLPVHLAVVDPGWTMGHNVVVDGYNSDHYFHLNFGWGGPSNGWYLLPEEIPYGLTVIEGAVVDILPQAVTRVSNVTDADFYLFPNPCQGILSLTSSKLILRLEIFSLTGKCLLDKSVNDHQTQINMEGYSQGNYMLKIRTSAGEIRRKVVKY